MGLFRRVNDAIDADTVRRAWKSLDRVDWRSWALQHGWTYQAEAPPSADRWGGFDGIEDCRHLMTTTLHDRAVMVFQRIAHGHMGWTEDAGVLGVNGFLIVRLPAAVSEPYASQPLYKTLRHFNVDLPADYTSGEIRDLELIAVHRGLHKPNRLQAEADLIALLTTMAPPDFWRH